MTTTPTRFHEPTEELRWMLVLGGPDTAEGPSQPGEDERPLVTHQPLTAPAWLYWAQHLEGEGGELLWDDGYLPVLALGTVADGLLDALDDLPPEELPHPYSALDDRWRDLEAFRRSPAALVECPRRGLVWVRAMTPLPPEPGGPVPAWAMVLCREEPELGGPAAPAWLRQGRSYAPLTEGEEACPPWD